MTLKKQLTILRIARSIRVAIRILRAIQVGLNIAPAATVEVFPARAWIECSATVGLVIGCLSSKGISAIVRCIVGTVHHVRIVHQYTVTHDLPGSVLGNRCGKRNAGREGDESKS